MTTMDLSPEPARGAVLLEQLKAVSLAVRREMILFTALLLGSWACLAWMFTRPGVPAAFPFEPGMIEAFAVFAFLVPLLVWRAENPERRTYLWSLRLSRRSGHFAKLASGWGWTMVTVALMVLWGWTLAGVTGSPILEKTIFLEPIAAQGGGAPEILGGARWYTYPLPGWLVLVPFGLATFLYLVGSAIVLSSNHPYRWGIGLYGLLLLLAVLAAAPIGGGGEFLHRLMGNDSPYGLATLGNPVIRTETLPQVTQPVAIPRADLGAWLSAMAVWGGLALAATYIAATRHREP